MRSEEGRDEESIDSMYSLHEQLPPVQKGQWARYFPFGFWYEWRHLAMLAIPIMLTSMSNYAIVPVSLFFLGRMGKTELAAGGLAISIFHVAGLSIIFGLFTASETLFSQTFGGSNKFRLGVQVQRAIVILTFCCFPCWAVYIIIEPILLATNQPPLVAKYTGNYLLGLIPGLFFATTIEIFNKYVQVQNKVYPPLLASIIGNCVNAGAHYLFSFYSDFGFVGSAISQSLGFMAQASVVVAYILISRIYRNTWDAIHIELWHDWGIWFRLAVPGMMMLGLEWWVCESGSLISGLRGEHALAVQTILNNFESLIYCTFPLGFCVASTIRIGQFLGANKAEGPISTSCVAIFTIVVFAIVNFVVIICTRFHIPRIFTSDPQVIQMAADGLIVIPCFLFADSLVAVCSGIIRGVGMQRTGAIVSMVCMYIIGGPTGLCLLMLTNLGVSGFWLGLCLGTGLESVVYIVIIKRIDWNEMCRKATKRTEIKFINRPPEQPDIVVKEEEARSLHEGDANLKACTPTTVCTRAAFILFCVSTVVAALVCRFKLDWKAHFPSYCLLNNGTILEINSSNVVQSSTYCHRILP